MTIDKPIQAKKVFYDISQKIVHPCKTRNTVTFDSKAEYEFYLMLDRLFPSHKYNIDIHYEILCGDISWKLDFLITAKTPSLKTFKQFAEIASIVNGRQFPVIGNNLYFEFKGRADNNYLRKMSYVKRHNGSLADTIILVSYDDGAFGYWDKEQRRFLTHAIIAQRHLSDIIKEVIWQE
ncbi:MAG: hypothetical protein V7L23_18660 [Nostoc sp.]|uniref:hypothetical protein n=1 Tax=Nostoc sp. TaxID=1180 RepID=UPI002FF10030